MKLSIKYHKEQAYSMPFLYLRHFVDLSMDSIHLIITGAEKTNRAQFFYNNKIEKKIVWDLIKSIYIVIDYSQKGKLAECPAAYKSNVVRGLHSIKNTLSEEKESHIVYKDFMQFIMHGQDDKVTLDVLDIMHRENSVDHIFIPCEIMRG